MNCGLFSTGSLRSRRAGRGNKSGYCAVRCGTFCMMGTKSCTIPALARWQRRLRLGFGCHPHTTGEKRVHVYVAETRPRLQGSRLSAWELEQYGIPTILWSIPQPGIFSKLEKWIKSCLARARVTPMAMLLLRLAPTCLPWERMILVFRRMLFPLASVDFGSASAEAIPLEEREPSEVLSLQYRLSGRT